jgi:large subunit ribosomal protein L4
VAQVAVYNDKGKAIGQAVIAERIAALEPHPQLVHDYAVAIQGNQRQWSANTRDRSMVTGSNKKPWRQKGTGRARAGTLKSPLFRGGGTVFGPKPKGKSVRVSLPRKVRRRALEVALADKLRAEKLVVLEKLELAEPRTRLMAALLKSLKLSGKVLVVATAIDDTVRRAARNIPNLALKTASNLSAMDVLRAGTLLLTRESLEPLGLVGTSEESAA